MYSLTIIYAGLEAAFYTASIMAFCSGMEPLFPEDRHIDLEDLAFELVTVSSSLAGQMNSTVSESVGELVRSMNCYYSNLIEGHNTVPRDIERALAHDYSSNPKKRNLQLEAVAHISLQEKIDRGLDENAEPTSVTYLRWLHRDFCSKLPPEMLRAENPETGEQMEVIPGEIRQHGVAVGIHIPPHGDQLQQCLVRFEEAYEKPASKLKKTIHIAAAHHRFLWIHPFLDGNGRVARLMAHAMFKRLGVGSSLWSVSRGLARNAGEYKALLMAADERRENDYDGRGALSERALTNFCRFFLTVSIDQVRFMQALLDPPNLLRRIELYCRDEAEAGRLPRAALTILREAMVRGEVERGSVPALINLQERAARKVTSSLLEKRLLLSNGPRSPLRLGFPVEAVERWFPALYPATN